MCIFDGNSISQWEHHISAITCRIESNSTRIELFYFDGNFRRIAQWVLAFSLSKRKVSVIVTWEVANGASGQQ